MEPTCESWSSFPVRMGELTVYSLDGVVVGYRFGVVQMLDPEGGIQLHVVYTVDSCLEVLDAYPFV